MAGFIRFVRGPSTDGKILGRNAAGRRARTTVHIRKFILPFTDTNENNNSSSLQPSVLYYSERKYEGRFDIYMEAKISVFQYEVVYYCSTGNSKSCRFMLLTL